MYVCFVLFFSQSWDNRYGLLDLKLKQSINLSINQFRGDGGWWDWEHIRCTSVNYCFPDMAFAVDWVLIINYLSIPDIIVMI